MHVLSILYNIIAWLTPPPSSVDKWKSGWLYIFIRIWLNNSWFWYFIYLMKFGIFRWKLIVTLVAFVMNVWSKIIFTFDLFSVRDKWILMSNPIKLEHKLHLYRLKKCMMYLFDTHYKWIQFCYVTFMQTNYILVMTMLYLSAKSEKSRWYTTFLYMCPYTCMSNT